MIHSLLGGIPELVDAEPEFQDTGNDDLASGTVTKVDNETATARSIKTFGSNGEEHGSHEQPRPKATLVSPNIGEQTRAFHEGIMKNEDEHDQSAVPSDVVPSSDTLLGDNSSPNIKPVPFPEAIVHSSEGGIHSSTLELTSSIPLPDSRPVSPTPSPEPSFPVHSTTPLPQEARSAGHHNPSPSASDRVPSRLRSSSLDLTCPSPMQSPTVAHGSTSQFGKSAPSKSRNKPAPLSLTYLLRQADDLLTTYPPSHPSLRVTEIMGPDSAMRTWRPLPISTKARDAIPEKQLYNETDDYLETLVNSSHIVIPSPPPSPLLGPRSAKKAKAPRAPGKALLDPRRIGLRLGALTPAERRVLFMGALLVVGAAVALKSSKVSCVDGIVKTSGGDGLKRLWSGKWTLISSAVAAWGRGLP